MLAVAILGGVKDRGKVQIDTDFVQGGADVPGESLYGILAHGAHLLCARGAFPLGINGCNAVHESAFLVGGYKRGDKHGIVDGPDVFAELVKVLEMRLHHQVTAEFIFQYEVGWRHVHHDHLRGLLLDCK